MLYAFSIAISNYYLKYISNSHSHSHFQQDLKTKVSIISPSSPLFLRRHVAIPASPRNISCVATQETAALSKGISCLTSQLPGQADSNAGTTIAFRPKMLYLCIVNETHWWGSLPDRIPRNCMEGMPDTETGLFTKKERNEENEKGNLEDDSASHRHGAHCTLYFTRSYELHAVHVETG